jgi:hypothetical protein
VDSVFLARLCDTPLEKWGGRWAQSSGIPLGLKSNKKGVTVRTWTKSQHVVGIVAIFAALSLVAGATGISMASAITHRPSSNLTTSAMVQGTATVTFAADNYTNVTTSQTENAGTATALAANPFTNVGNTFAGWNTSPTGVGTAYADGATFPFTSSVTLYAMWTQIFNTVTFNANGGTGSMASQTYVYGTVADLYQNSFTNTGKSFTGWNTAPDGTGAAYSLGSSYTFTANATLYAQWGTATETVTFIANYGGIVPETSQTEVYGVATHLNPNPYSVANIVFTGWSTVPSGGGTSYADGASFPFTSSIVLYGQWTQTAATAQFNCSGGTGSVASITTAIGQTIILPAGACTRAGYSFTHWNTAPDGSGAQYAAGAQFVLTWDPTFYAEWLPVIPGTPPGDFTVTFISDGGVPVAPITAASIPSLPSDTWTDHTFNGWFTEAVGGTRVTTVTGYTLLFAQWTLALPTQAPGTATLLLTGNPTPFAAGNSYEVVLYTPAGGGTPVGGLVAGTITITDSSATPGTCSSSTWSYFGPDGVGGDIYGANCAIASVEASGVTVQASYSGSNFAAPSSNVVTVGGTQGSGTGTGTVTSVTASNSATVTLTGSVNGAAITVSIPAGALPPGTTVTMYPVANTSNLSAQVPAGQSYVVALGVKWETPSGGVPVAVSPITLTVSSPTIVAGDTIYIETSSGLTPVGTATVNGTVTVTFESDPTFLVTSTVLIDQASLSVTTAFGHLGTALHLATSGGSGTGRISYKVTDGTARGCAVIGTSLHARSPGTCVVIAKREGDATYNAVSSMPTSVTLALPARPSTVTVRFITGGSGLSASAKRSLLNLSSKLIRGASVTVTGCAMGNAALAKERAVIAALFLKRNKLIHVKIKASAASNNSVTITTNVQ